MRTELLTIASVGYCWSHLSTAFHHMVFYHAEFLSKLRQSHLETPQATKCDSITDCSLCQLKPFSLATNSISILEYTPLTCLVYANTLYGPLPSATAIPNMTTCTIGGQDGERLAQRSSSQMPAAEQPHPSICYLLAVLWSRYPKHP